MADEFEFEQLTLDESPLKDLFGNSRENEWLASPMKLNAIPAVVTFAPLRSRFSRLIPAVAAAVRKGDGRWQRGIFPIAIIFS
jgi:hypothetical protein